MENQPKLNSSREVITWLAERFPQCFSTEGEARPLKIGIFQDLVERIQGEKNLSKTQLRSALRLYTSSWRYLYGIKAGASRVDLDGNVCGELNSQHIEHARKQLEEAKARVQAQRGKQPIKKREMSAEEENHRQRRFTRARPAGTGEGINKPRSRPLRLVQDDKPAEAQRHKTVTDIAALLVGQNIKVKAGKSAMEATVLEITKDGVRVELASGLAMIVRAEHLQF